MLINVLKIEGNAGERPPNVSKFGLRTLVIPFHWNERGKTVVPKHKACVYS